MVAGYAVDFEALRALVYKLWPPPAPKGQKNRSGRPYTDRVPVVCAILAYCDLPSGKLASPTALVNRLKAEDPEYRQRCGFTEPVPCLKTVTKTHQRMLRHWTSFTRCFIEPPLGSLLLDDATGASSGVDGVVKERRVYTRDWPKYNGAQTHELGDVLELLDDICRLVDEIDVQERSCRQRGRGRARSPLGVMLFAMVYKAFIGQSARRIQSQLRVLAGAGYMPECGSSASVSGSAEARKRWVPCFNSINGYYGCEWLTPILLELITMSATAVRSLETDFTMDATGCSTASFARWVDYRTNSELKEHNWVKLHMICGALTNVITRAAVSPSDMHDNVLFGDLFIETARRFRVRRVTADMAYASRANYEMVRGCGSLLYVPFKSNTAPWVDDGTAWSAALWEFQERHLEFMDTYHQRSNAESTFSALKRKFPSQIRMEAYTGQVNETLCKVLAYNLSGVAREVRMRGVKPDFPSEADLLAQSIARIYR